MIGIILAAGRGTRLRPHTEETPKPLLKLSNQCILERQVQQFVESGVDEIVVVTGYKGGQIESLCSQLQDTDLKDIEIQLIHNDEYEATDNLYSLYLALREIDISPFVVVNGDVVCDSSIIDHATKSPHESIAFYDSGNFDSGELKLATSSDRATKILEPGKENGAGSTIDLFALNAEAAQLIYDDLKDRVASGETNEWFEISLDAILEDTRFESVDVNDLWWIDIDTKEDLEKVRELLEDPLQN